MSAPSSHVDPEEREKRLRELAKRLGDEEQIECDNANQAKREYANIKQDLTQKFSKFIKTSEECKMNRDILEAKVYKNIADEINESLKKFENL
jgi:predicted nucleotide-binding protein (sugar kinase/HSP70/actin superfamily)